MTETARGSVSSNGSGATGAPGQRLSIGRVFTTAGVHPYAEVTWERRDVVMTNWRDGSVNFEQRGVEFPDFWSVNAANIVTTKYFRGAVGTPQREHSLRQLIDRVVGSYVTAGRTHGYLATAAEAEVFEHELTYALLHQIFSFNSPVWFNVGTSSPQQVSACFILAVEDTMDSILNWYREEGLIFKGGSGAGLNLSRIRSSRELLSSGGTASGPISFMRGADASAGTIKSGGATRRAAKMVVLDVDHPDIEEFVRTKAREEDKIRALREAGFDMDLGGKDIVSVQYQNANNSIRDNDEFMQEVEEGSAFLDRLHELVVDPDGVVGVLVLDGHDVLAAEVHVETGLAQGPDLVLLAGLGLDELLDVRVVDVQDHHLRCAAGRAAGLDGPGGCVRTPHEGDRAAGRAAGGEQLLGGPDAREVEPGARATLEDHPLLAVPVQDRVHRVVDREDEAGAHLLRGRGAHVEPHGGVEGEHLVQQHPGQLVLEAGRVLVGGEVAVVASGLRVGQDDPADELLEAPLPDGGADRPAEVLGRDDGGSVHRPRRRELHTLLLEDGLAGPPVGLHDVAALPLDLVVGVRARRREDPFDRQARLARLRCAAGA